MQRMIIFNVWCSKSVDDESDDDHNDGWGRSWAMREADPNYFPGKCCDLGHQIKIKKKWE